MSALGTKQTSQRADECPLLAAKRMHEVSTTPQSLGFTNSLTRLIQRFCTVATGKTFRAASMSSTVTSLRPACRMVPSSISSMASNCSSRGTFGSMRCSCHSPICSTPASAAAHGLLPQVVGPPIGLPHVGPGTREAGFGGDEHASIGLQRLADELLRHVGPVGIRRIDKIDAKLGHALECRIASARSSGGPQMPSPVMRMAPKPRRLILMSPPILKVPDFAAFA